LGGGTHKHATKAADAAEVAEAAEAAAKETATDARSHHASKSIALQPLRALLNIIYLHE